MSQLFSKLRSILSVFGTDQLNVDYFSAVALKLRTVVNALSNWCCAAQHHVFQVTAEKLQALELRLLSTINTTESIIIIGLSY